VELVKKVPHGAGLGGGSGNAATAMWAGAYTPPLLSST